MDEYIINGDDHRDLATADFGLKGSPTSENEGGDPKGWVISRGLESVLLMTYDNYATTRNETKRNAARTKTRTETETTNQERYTEPHRQSGIDSNSRKRIGWIVR